MGTVLAPEVQAVDTTRARRPDASGFIERDGVSRVLGALWRRVPDGAAHAYVVDLPFPALEAADPVSVPPVPGRDVRRAGQRTLRPAGRTRRIRRHGIRRRRDRGARCDRNGSGRRGRFVDGCRVHAPASPPNIRIASSARSSSARRSPSSTGRAWSRRSRSIRRSRSPRPDDPTGASTTPTTGAVTSRVSPRGSSGEKMFTEPHSTKPIEDGVGWTLETDAGHARHCRIRGVHVAARRLGTRSWRGSGDPVRRRVRCPALVIHGDDDHISRLAVGERLAHELRAPLLTIAGGGHAPQARWPVIVNRAIRDFIRSLPEASNDGR